VLLVLSPKQDKSSIYGGTAIDDGGPRCELFAGKYTMCPYVPYLIILLCFKPIFHWTNLFATNLFEGKKYLQCDWSAKKFAMENVGSVPTFLLFAQTNLPVENGLYLQLIFYGYDTVYEPKFNRMGNLSGKLSLCAKVFTGFTV
jgi:hypothetical protein